MYCKQKLNCGDMLSREQSWMRVQYLRTPNHIGIKKNFYWSVGNGFIRKIVKLFANMHNSIKVLFITYIRTQIGPIKMLVCVLLYYQLY